jgi:hypothetical protein
MSEAEVERLYAGLAGEGRTEAQGLGFTLESSRAREKLQEFALDQPENYQLLVLAGLFALGSRRFHLTIDADELVVTGERPAPRQPLTDLWSFVSRGSTDATVIGFRLLAMAILTSVRFDEMEWTLESVDGEGGWRHQVRVRRGLLSESGPAAHAPAGSGFLVRARRKSLSQVARRFFGRWFHSRARRDPPDEALIRRRVLLPRGGELICNGKPLLQRPTAGGVLAVLQTGEAPQLVECSCLHTLQRDYTLTLLLCHPSTSSQSPLPGQPNHIQWIWNGLSMDSTTLGQELEAFRAFVWAPELRPDLSFTSLVDNRDKQALERTVRSLARELLDRWVREFSAGLKTEDDLSSSRDLLGMVRQIIRRRIDTNKDWSRLASLNRALVDCPLMAGSGPDGRQRLVTFRDIYSELNAGRPVAAFFPETPPRPVPAWPDRPLVLYSDAEDYEFLRSRFPRFEFASADLLLKRLDALSAKSPGVVPSSSRGKRPALSGTSSVGDVALNWWLPEPVADGPASVGTLIVKGDARSFEDRTLGLPKGIVVEARADWAESYLGGLSDSRLRGEIKRALLSDLCRALAERLRGKVTELGCRFSEALLEALTEPSLISAELSGLEWLAVRNLQGATSLKSPDQMAGTLRTGLPLYAQSWSCPLPARVPPAWLDVPVAIVSPSAWNGLAVLLGQEVHDARVFNDLPNRVAPNWVPALWFGAIGKSDLRSPHVRALSMNILRSGSQRLAISVQGMFIKVTSHKILPHVHLAVDWETGWPGDGAKVLLGGPSSEERREILRQGCRVLARMFFASVAAEHICSVPPDLVGEMMFELLSEPETAEQAVFLRGDGRKVRLQDLPSTVRYVTVWPDHGTALDPDAVYLPGPMAEGVMLLSDRTWLPLGSESEAAPSAVDTEEARLRLASTDPADPDPRPTDGLPALALPGPGPEAAPEVGQMPEPALEPKARQVPESEPPAPAPEEAPEPEIGLAPEEAPDRTPAVFPVCSILHALSEEAERVFGQEKQRLLECLASAQYDPTQDALLKVESDGQVLLGRPSLKLVGSFQGRLMLLSAVYSVHNRASDRIDDAQERSFHMNLLRHALGKDAGHRSLQKTGE